MIRKTLILLSGGFVYLSVAVLSFAQEFQREIDTIPVHMGDEGQISNPFDGGLGPSLIPSLVDIDNDKDFDLIVADEIRKQTLFYRNNGTVIHPVFKFETDEFGLGYREHTTFADIDNDGDLDWIATTTNWIAATLTGIVKLYINNGTAIEPSFHWAAIILARLEPHPTPTFADIDDDGDLDLFAGVAGGAGEESGYMYFFRNMGTATKAEFELVTDRFVPKGGWGTRVPNFADIDNDGDLDLFVGESFGKISFFRNTGTRSDPNYTLETEKLADIETGSKWLTFADIDNDNDLDLLAGSPNADFYKNKGSATEPSLIPAPFLLTLVVGSRSKPTFADIDNDGDLDLFIGESEGNLNFYQNVGTITDPVFALETETFESIDVGNASTPTFVDIDNDGDLDLFIGESEGNLNYYQNVGSATEARFTFVTAFFASIIVPLYSAPEFADIDADGDLDLFVGSMGQTISFYRNTGTATNAGFTLDADSINIGGEVSYNTPAIADIDRDGDLDLFVGNIDGRISLLRNTGIATEPNFTFETGKLFDIDVRGTSSPTFADIDNDCDSDLFVGDQVGGLYFYRNVSPTSVSSSALEGSPETFILNQNYPNPFNPETTIRFELPKSSHVVIKIFNTVGQEIRTLVDRLYEAGNHTIGWDGKDNHGTVVANGVYLYKLQAPDFTQVRKMSLIK
jgi:hypothetical protein